MCNYEILDHLPSFYEEKYLSITSNDIEYHEKGFVVRFYKTDGKSWVGNFKEGCTALTGIYNLSAINRLLVLAGGAAYIIDCAQIERPIYISFDFSSICPVPNGKFVLAGFVGLTVIEVNGTIWETERISLDGLKNISLDGNLVNGLSLELGTDPVTGDKEWWVPFSYDINTRVLAGGSNVSFL